MPSFTMGNASPPFRIGLPSSPGKIFVQEVDPIVRAHLVELNAALSRRVIEPPLNNNKLKALLNDPLRAKRSEPADWPAGSLVASFKKPEDEKDRTLAEVINGNAELSVLKFEFHEALKDTIRSLPFNTRTVLAAEFPAISDYLLARAYFVDNVRELNAMKSALLKSSGIVQDVVDYAVVGAARTIITNKRLTVVDHNDDDSDIVRRIRKADLSMLRSTFGNELQRIIDDHIFNNREIALIKGAEKTLGEIPDSIEGDLVRYMRASPVEITPANINHFLPVFISRIVGDLVTQEPEYRPEPSAEDFQVDFFTDDGATIEVSAASVKCAAQLYFSMVLGDELDIFDCMNYFTHKRLLREAWLPEDPTLRRNLQDYVFQNEFTIVDRHTNRTKTLTRTRPAERQMFYRQVFDEGGGEPTEDVIVNQEFPGLWKILMVESKNCIERLQDSPNAESFVSQQPVRQAAEDLQYNLSLHCTGMATVMAPLIYEELNFILRKIFGHPEVLDLLAPGLTRSRRAGGLDPRVWKVIERLHQDMSGTRPRATVLNSKAEYGNSIINALADFDDTFSNDERFLEFLGTVDAYIISRSILQTDPRRKPDMRERVNGNGYGMPVPEMAGAPSPNGNGTGGEAEDEEWDF